MKQNVDSPTQDATDDELGDIGSGVLSTLTFLLIAYIPATIIGELFGNRGMPASPWLITPAVALLAAVMMSVQSRLENRSWWKRVDDVWGALLLGLTVVTPIVVAVVWPVSLWPGLPPLVPTVLSCVPLVLAWWCVRQWHRHLRNRQQPRFGPFTPVPRINEPDSGEQD
ncbi:hypothetical protein GCM10018785_69320 [Streptomyces longispororuber]|uniref:Uncharacterized protein n=1 Tax=Streptomyces longispororuber TaxID=68230 RepID=A0A919A8A2_9ACTN|nr:hypothetical protein [Streptomyces longispororuber]GHE93656.1 hypothetical protein GCM10018785_69320 [Streptomyces longispororuber]